MKLISGSTGAAVGFTDGSAVHCRTARSGTSVGASPADQSVSRSAAVQLQAAIDRPRHHGREDRRRRGVGERSEHHLSRLRRWRRVEVGEQRDDVRAGIRHVWHRVDWRHRHPSDESEHRLHRDRRSEQQADLVVRRRHVQDDRRREDLHAHRTARDADDRADRDRSEKPRHASTWRRPVTCSARTPIAASTRRPTAARRGRRSSSSTITPGSRTSRSIRPTAASSTPRAISGAAADAASTAAVRAARSGRPRTPARRGRGCPRRACRPGRTAAWRSTSRDRIREVVYAQIEAGETGAAAPENTPPGAAAVTPPGRAGGAGRAGEAGAAGRAGGAGGRATCWRRPRRAIVRLVQQRRSDARLSGRRWRRRWRWWRRRTAAFGLDAAGARRAARRDFPLGESGRDMDARQQLQRASNVFQPDSHRPDERQDDLRRRPAGREVARRRQDVHDARRRRRRRDRPATSISTPSGSTRRTRSTS